MRGETCHWAAILSDPALVSVVYIAVKIPWVQRLTQYLEGAMGPPSTNLWAPICILFVPHPVLYLAPGSLPLVWPLA